MLKTLPGEWSVRRVTRLGFLASVGAALFVLESLIPLPLPFLKVGLANISTLVTLIVAGPADALIVVFLRVLVGSLVTGSFFSPSFVLAMSAGIVSAAVMGGVRIIAGRALGPVGVSLAGSSAHVSTQIAMVGLLYVRNAAVMHLLPLLLVTALVGGLIVGFVTIRLLPALGASGAFSPRQASSLPGKVTPWDATAGAVLCACIAASFFALPAAEGTAVLVEVGGRTVEKLDIHENREVSFRTEKGIMRLEVRDGSVRVVEADCPNRICVRTGWRSREGDVIVCVPNRTVIRILGKENSEVGGITG
jgi:heptaprenyl diphosphate synthase